MQEQGNINQQEPEPGNEDTTRPISDMCQSVHGGARQDDNHYFDLRQDTEPGRNSHPYLMKKLLTTFVLIAALVTTAAAQTEPKTRRFFDWKNQSLLGTSAVALIGDAVSTQRYMAYSK